jgi:hypothetical protein
MELNIYSEVNEKNWSLRDVEIKGNYLTALRFIMTDTFCKCQRRNKNRRKNMMNGA